MKKLEINRNLINSGKAFILSAVLLGSIMTFGGCKKKEVPDDTLTVQVMHIDSIKANDNSGSLFNVGNFKIKGNSNLNDIKRANKKGVPVGIIINTIAENKADIYKDAQYAKYLLENSDIDYPVYLDVTELLNNEKLRMDEIMTLISAFCSKLSSNKFYVGICGTYADLELLKNIDNNNILSAYTTLTLNENEENITLSKSERAFIEENELNNPSGFTCDDIYYVKDGDKLSEIAFNYELSVEDLLSYNGLKSDAKISDITMLRIPTRNIPRVRTINRSVANMSDTPLIGADISYAQGNNKFDLDKMKSSLDFAIIRASQYFEADEYFEKNIDRCMQAGLPVRAYCFNEITPNHPDDADFKSAVEKQTQVFLDTISGKHITLPAYLDQEKEYKYSENQVVIMLDNWYDAMIKAGYTPGIYMPKSIYLDFKTKYDNRYGKGTFDSKFDRWIAGDYDYFNEANFYWDDEVNTPLPYNSLINLLNNKQLTPSDLSSERWDVENADIVQISEMGIAEGYGLGSEKNYVDIDITFKNYIEIAYEESLISEKEAEFLRTMEPEQVSKLWYGFSTWCNCNPLEVGALCGVTSAALVLAVYKIFKNKERLFGKKKCLKK